MTKTTHGAVTRVARTLPAMLIVLSLTAVAAGCGGGSDSTAAPLDTQTVATDEQVESPIGSGGSALAIDPCALVTVAEAEEIAGNDPITRRELPAAETQGAARACSFGLDGGGHLFHVDVLEASDLDSVASPSLRDPLDEIGEESFSALGVPYARVGAVAVRIRDADLNIITREDPSIDLLRLAAARVGSG